MAAKPMILRELNNLPDEALREVAKFIRHLKKCQKATHIGQGVKSALGSFVTLLQSSEPSGLSSYSLPVSLQIKSVPGRRSGSPWATNSGRLI